MKNSTLLKLASGVWLFGVLLLMGLLALGVHSLGTDFALGLLIAFVMTQVAARMKFGDWI